MNLNNISKLSDNQLVELYRNPSTVKEIKKRILKEIELRNLNYKENEITEDNEFSQNQILTLIFTPFLIRSHRKSMFKEKWSSKRDKQFWFYITIGIALYTFLLFIALTFRNT